MRAYVGVTDGDWYAHLAARGHLEEVNFWRPGGERVFRVLTIGEPFFFKTHFSDNRVVGGGFYSGFAALTLNEAWRFFGEQNGASNLEQMRTRIARYRRHALQPGEDPRIGCVFVRDVVFFPGETLPEAPPGFAASVVQGKSYDVGEPEVADYFQHLLGLILGGVALPRPDYVWHRDGPIFGDPRLSRHRLGQHAFQGVVLEAYRKRCAVTGDRIRPVLQAAHIRPLTRGGEHRLDNGLLLRSDVHTLFDQGYLAVRPDHRLMVSPQLRREFENGEEFYARAESGTMISLPTRKTDRPNQEFLEWHRDTIFRVS